MDDNGLNGEEYKMTFDNTGKDDGEGVNNVRITSDKAEYPDSRLAGLNRWLPGESGNPNGRPTGSRDGLRAHFKRLVDRKASLDEIREFGIEVEAGNDPLKAEVLVEILWLQIKKGDMVAIKEAFAQLELPHPKNVNLTADFNVSIPSQFADAF